MLHVISSNRLEHLLEAMAISMLGEESADPFVPVTMVVQNAGMSRWVSQQIALKQGISAHIRFETPGTFLWSVAREWIDELPDIPYRKDLLTWQIFTALEELLPADEFSQLQSYLATDNTGLLRMQLAQSIGNAFDRYLIYRPELINSWEAGADHHWQAILWRRVCGEIQGHWGHIEKHLSRIAGTKPVNTLPEKISVFGISAMPPLYTSVFAALAAHTSIDLYYLNPCEQYWADIVDEQHQSRRRAKARKAGLDDPTGLLDIGNPLLASWGHAGQAFLDQLLELGVAESECFEEPHAQTLLSQVQHHILDLQDQSIPLVPGSDSSIQIHSSHSALREVQILHDQLLCLFEQHDDLKPRDIIVMAPDIDRYAPFVDATFALSKQRGAIPWSISDRRLRTEQQALEVLNWLLNLPLSRFESTEILALLDLPAVRSKFSVDNGSVQLMRQWVRDTGIRWSLDASMRESLQLPASEMNSWRFGLRRLFLGYALPDMNGELYNGIAPYAHIEGAQSEDLEVLAQLVERCAKWRVKLQSKYSAAQWLVVLDQLISDFFDPEDSEAQGLLAARNQLFELLDTSGTVADSDLLLSREVIAELYHQVLEDTSNERHFLTGKVTFSNMVPMRSIPFRVVCILGLNADDFPRSDNPQSFDLIASHPKRGDRQRRNDDRYLFLEALLSARDTLYLSYVGRDVRDNSEKAASTVVTELAAYANVQTTEHPLQPFSQKYFDNSSPQLFSYKDYWCKAANIEQQAESPRFIDDHYQSGLQPSYEVELPELVEYFIKPSEAWLRRCLDIRSGWREDDLESSEPFTVNGLDRWKLKQHAYELFSQGDSQFQIKQKLIAHGEVPEGVPGEREIEAVYASSVALDRRVLNYKTEGVAAVEIDLDIGDFNLYGRFSDVRSDGLFSSRFGRLRAKDLLTSWITHLTLCEVKRGSGTPSSVLVCEDYTVKFSNVSNANDWLVELLQIRHQGLMQPLAWLPGSAYVRFLAQSDTSLGFPQGTWTGASTPEAMNELAETAASIVWRGIDPYDAEFDAITNKVFEPLFNHATFIKAELDVV